MDLVDDADDRGIERSALAAERLTGGAALEDDQHFFVDSRAHGVRGHQRRPFRRVVQVQRLHEEQLGSLKFLELLGRNDVPNDTRNQHVRNGRASRGTKVPRYFRETCQLSTMPTMAASTGGSTG